jgi:putative membrane protein
MSAPDASAQASPAGDPPHRYDPTETLPLALLGVRGAIGGVLMGLANLVPGISGGTMLLAAGVYPAFITAIAEITTLKFRLRSILLLGAIVGTALLGILLLAGLMRMLVIEQRWVMYSLFIGLTLGGVPLVWRLARPGTPGVYAGAAAAFAGMVLMQLGVGGDGTTGEASTIFLFFSGLAGASAMILPGVSGGYLLLLLGQYEVILGAIDTLKQGLLGGPDLALVLESMTVVIPVGIGVVAGVVGVSNLLRWLLDRFEKPTLGALLGLLFGAVVGLWPFSEPIPPQPGDRVDGQVLTVETVAKVDIEDWKRVSFDPSAGQAAGALGLVALGIGATALVARVGGRDESSEAS